MKAMKGFRLQALGATTLQSLGVIGMVSSGLWRQDIPVEYLSQTSALRASIEPSLKVCLHPLGTGLSLSVTRQSSHTSAKTAFRTFAFASLPDTTTEVGPKVSAVRPAVFSGHAVCTVPVWVEAGTVSGIDKLPESQDPKCHQHDKPH